MNNITITGDDLRVDGKVVAKVTNFALLRDALFSKLTRTEAVYLAVSLLGEGRTSEIARLLQMDKANASKRLQVLEEEGRVEIVDDSHTIDGKPGRPSRVWSVTE